MATMTEPGAQPRTEHSRDLTGKVALITGGARGLGEAITRTLAQAGARVVPADIRAEQVDRVVADLCAQGLSARSVQLDVRDEHQVQDAIDDVMRTFGRLDILVNNAGTDLTVSIDEMPIAEWDRILAVNLRGPCLTSKRALSVMKRQGS